ncbi:hypothetical protein LTR37_017270 [Vermiconidia calcicola]|uniref:Uncharacterized protein n=1 Tax=Vermiconidia calcicola TaxID=1690605 RepID=A0ACC3MKG5_9PEZI|nr:hypothetical protein LTR37_017270 [Vermiconidia calcicola]
MSINWVMLAPSSTPPYTPLPSERTLFTSSPRIAFSVTTPAHYPGKQQKPFSLSAASGVLYLTNRRIIFLPNKSTPQLQSFAAPILNLHDSHVAAPWFGPNVWTALLQPTQGGGIEVPASGVVEVKFTFKEGGAFDFHTQYERVRERLQQAVEVQRMDGGDGAGASRAAMNGVDVAGVDLEELPAYAEEGDGPLIPPIVTSHVTPATQTQVQQNGSTFNGQNDDRTRPRPSDDTPTEPPPGYEEAQMASLQDEMDRRVSGGR